MRFSLTRLFGIVTVCAILCASAYWFGVFSRGPRDAIRRARIGVPHFKGVGHSVLIRQDSEPSWKALQELRALSPPVHELIVIGLSELQFEYDAFAKHPRIRRADGGSRVNIYNKNWL